MSAAQKLFANATVYHVTGRDYSAVSYVYDARNTFAPESGTVYFFSICNGYVGIWKISDRTVNSTAIFRSSTSNGGIMDFTGSPRRYYYRASGYVSASAVSTTSATRVYGCTLATIQFAASDTEVDSVLASLTADRLVYRNTSSSSTGTTADTTDSVLLISQNNGIEIVTDKRKILLNSGSPGTINGDAVSVTGYGYSIIGLS